MDCKIRKYFDIKEEDIDDFKALIYGNSSIELLVEKLISIKHQNIIEGFNPICINTLVKVFNEIIVEDCKCKTLYDIICNFGTIDNITINKYRLFEKNFKNANI